MEEAQIKQDVSFLANLKLSEEAKKAISQVGSSRELKTIVWDKIVKIANSNAKTTEEAAANFYRIKGIISVITE
jgi:predicted component of type VI protein secretion system